MSCSRFLDGASALPKELPLPWQRLGLVGKPLVAKAARFAMWDRFGRAAGNCGDFCVCSVMGFWRPLIPQLVALKV